MSSKLALLGGKPVVTGPVTESWPQFDQDEATAVMEVLESGNWNHGPKCQEFEEEFARLQNAKYGLLCTCGTAALEVICRGAKIGVGDEVITSPYTFHGTCMGIMMAGGTVTFADIDPDTNNIDPDAIEVAITPRTRAIMVVHFGGLACDMNRILDIAAKHDLLVLEDAAHGWGAQYAGRGLGSWGLASGFSFQQSKNMTSGEGGIALTSDEEMADIIGCVINSGRSIYERAPEELRWGGNHRITDFLAAILLCQLERVEAQNDIREQNAAMLTRALSQLEGIDPIRRVPEATRVSWHVYGARFNKEAFEGVSRSVFMRALRAEGVPVGSGYSEPVYKNPVFQHDWQGGAYKPLAWTTTPDAPDYRDLQLPNVEQYCRERISISQTVMLTSENRMGEVVNAFEKVCGQAKELIGLENKEIS